MQLSDLALAGQKRYGELLRALCEASGLTQGKLSRLAEKERKSLIERREISAECKVGSLAQPTFSQVLAGKVEPTYFQVYIWLRVVRQWYGSLQLAALCEERGVEVPVWSHALECQLWHLAGYAMPTEIEEAYAIPVLSPSHPLIDHKEQRFSRV